jgi:hypothetical protein
VRVQDAGVRIEDAGVRVDEARVRDEDAGVRVEEAPVRVVDDADAQVERTCVRVEGAGVWAKPEIRFKWAIFRFVISREKVHISPYFARNLQENVLFKKRRVSNGFCLPSLLIAGALRLNYKWHHNFR